MLPRKSKRVRRAKRRRMSLLRKGTLSLFLSLLLASPSLAAEDPAASDDVYQLPTVTVTADKRTTDVQKTPSSITVMSRTKLEDANIDTIEKVLQRIPNMNFSQFTGGANFMSIRGITTSAGTSTSPIVMYLDGVPVDTFFNLDAPLMDIERIEILRGPQSAIYGKNAMGGVINVISRKPTNEWHGTLQADYGSFNTQRYAAAISGPLIEDKLYLALSGSHYSTDGYMNHDDTWYGNQERTERFKGMLRFTPTEDIDISFHLNYTARRDGYSNLIWGDEPTLDSIANKDDYLHSDIWNMALQMSFDFDPVTFESITTYRTENLDYGIDMQPAYQYMFNTDPRYQDLGAVLDSVNTGRNNTRKEFTQEFRLRSPDDEEGVRWLLGVFGGYTDMNIRESYSDTLGSAMGYPLSMWSNQPSHEYTQDYAAFGEITIPLLDKLNVTLGLRAQQTYKKINVDSIAESEMMNMQRVENASFHESDSWFELLPKFNISYQLTDDIMFYGGVNRSFIPGGFNNATTTGIDMTYDAQTAWNYEIGAKTEWFDKRFLLNLALFHSAVEDMQVMKYDIGSMSYLSDNAGSARIYGVEVDAMARLLPGLDAEFSFGYLWTRFDDYSTVDSYGIRHDYAGNKIPYTPDYTASFALQYRHEKGFFARGEVLHYGQLYWSEASDYKRDPVTLLNARVGYEFEPFAVYVYGNNLTDAKYLNYYTATSNYGMMARPREIGVQLKYTF